MMANKSRDILNTKRGRPIRKNKKKARRINNSREIEV
jgi:hypothetical protein